MQPTKQLAEMQRVEPNYQLHARWLTIACAFLYYSSPDVSGAVVASHSNPQSLNAVYGTGCFFMGQSFTVNGALPVFAATFSWIGVQRMPSSDRLYILDRPYSDNVSSLGASVDGLVATADLVSGTMTYQFGPATVLQPSTTYFAYMSTSLLQDPLAPLPYNTVGYFGPAEVAFPTNYSNWHPGAPLNWFDSYTEGEAFIMGGYLRDGPFVPLSENNTSPLKFELDFLFEVVGTQVPEPATIALIGLSLSIQLCARRRSNKASHRMTDNHHSRQSNHSSAAGHRWT